MTTKTKSFNNAPQEIKDMVVNMVLPNITTFIVALYCLYDSKDESLGRYQKDAENLHDDLSALKMYFLDTMKVVADED